MAPQISPINRAAPGESGSWRGQVQGPWLHLDCQARQLNSFCFCRVVHGAAKSDSRSREPTSPIQGTFWVPSASLSLSSLPPFLVACCLAAVAMGTIWPQGQGLLSHQQTRWPGTRPGRWSNAQWRQKSYTSIRNTPSNLAVPFCVQKATGV